MGVVGGVQRGLVYLRLEGGGGLLGEVVLVGLGRRGRVALALVVACHRPAPLPVDCAVLSALTTCRFAPALAGHGWSTGRFLLFLDRPQLLQCLLALLAVRPHPHHRLANGPIPLNTTHCLDLVTDYLRLLRLLPPGQPTPTQLPNLPKTSSKLGLIGVHLCLQLGEMRVKGVEVLGELVQVEGFYHWQRGTVGERAVEGCVEVVGVLGEEGSDC